MSAIATVTMKIFMDTDITGNPLLYTAVLAVITAVQFIGLGFLGEMHTRTYYEARRKPTYIVQRIVVQKSVETN